MVNILTMHTKLKGIIFRWIALFICLYYVFGKTISFYLEWTFNYTFDYYEKTYFNLIVRIKNLSYPILKLIIFIERNGTTRFKRRDKKLWKVRMVNWKIFSFLNILTLLILNTLYLVYFLALFCKSFD